MQCLQSQVVVTNFTANRKTLSVEFERIINAVFTQGVEVVSFQIGFYLDDVAVAKLTKTVSMFFFLAIHQLQLHQFIKGISFQKISCCLVFVNLKPEIVAKVNILHLTVYVLNSTLLILFGHNFRQFFYVPIVQSSEDAQFTAVQRHHDAKIKVDVLSLRVLHVKSVDTLLEDPACLIDHQLHLPPMSPFLLIIILRHVFVDSLLFLRILKIAAHKSL